MHKEFLLIEAIKNRKPIEFEYKKEGKVLGKRIGNPHIIFIHPTTKKREIHIFQTGGVSDSNLSIGLPWRLFIIDFMENIKTLEDEPAFGNAEGYNPESPLYRDVIAKL